MASVWKPIPGFEGWYEASLDGTIRSVDRSISIVPAGRQPYSIRCKGRVLRPCTPADGYPRVTLWVRHRRFDFLVGSLVALTFLGPRPAGHEVRHLDGKNGNAAATNLAYGTPAENAADKRRHGTHLEGEAIPWARLTETDVRRIRSARGLIRQTELASRYGVGQSQIGRIQRGCQWRHVA